MATRAQVQAEINNRIVINQGVVNAALALDNFLRRSKYTIDYDNSDHVQAWSQAEIDSFVAINTPKYTQAKADLVTAYNLLP